MKVINGTTFNDNTPDRVCEILSSCIGTRRRIRVFYGDRETGRDWHEVYYTMGIIGRSTGTQKIPLMIAKSTSIGGPAILDDCIVKITEGKRTLYQQGNYDPSVKRVGTKIYDTHKNEVIFSADNEQKAERELQFFLGTRNAH